jgi:TonB-dependent starch-binding outer membrane protein SusC
MRQRPAMGGQESSSKKLPIMREFQHTLRHGTSPGRFRCLATLLTLCLLTILNTPIAFAGGDTQTINLNVQNAPLEKVFSEIEKQTHYSFLYMQSLVQKAKHVTVKISNASLEKVLEICFKDQPQLTYSIMDKVVVVKPAVQTPKGGEKQVGEEQDPIDVTGKVVDENGKPVAGVTVTVKGTRKQTITNENGEFKISQVEKNAVLTFSSVNMEAFAINVSGQTEILAKLKTKTSELDEVQIIAYGQTTKRFQTGNVTTVKGSDIEKQPVSNVLQALAGRVPGLFVTQVNGLSGGAVMVRVQGQNSIGNGGDPFYVVDGVPYYSQLRGTGVDDVLGSSGLNGRGSPLNYINPTDIESIDVLKDADATAIYGSRAANGAILITTKKGKAGAPKIDLNVRTGGAKVTRKWDMMNTEQYLQMRNEAFVNDGWGPDPSSDYDLLFWDTTRYTDWQKTLIGGTAHFTDINGSVSGGSTNVQYLVGGTYHHETTVFPGDFSDEKAASHFNFTTNSTNRKFRMEFSGNYMLDLNRLPQAGNLTQKAYLLEPNAPSIYKEDGTLNWAQTASGTSTWINPLSYTLIKYRNKTSNLIANTILNYLILPGLEVKGSFGYTSIHTDDYNPTPSKSIRPERRLTTQNSAGYGNRNQSSWIIEPMVNYRRTIGKSKLDLLAGSSIQQNKSNGGYVVGSGYNSDEQLENIASATSFFVGNSFVTQYKYAALFGKFNYNWIDKYIFNLAFRRDGSSRFGEKNQYHNFWSLGGAWLFSQEKVVKKLRFLSFGKLRASYGTTGSDQIVDYQFLSTYNTVGNNGRPYQNRTGLEPAGLPNPYLQWEETRKLQGGIELGFFADRIYINATYALNRSSNQLLSTVLPSFVGYSSITANFPAMVQNTSWEFSMQTVNVKSRSFQWTSNLNLTVPRNKLVSFPNFEKSPYTKNLIIGEPLYIEKAFHYMGVDPATGKYQMADANGTLTPSPSYPSDATVLISTFPKYYGGFLNSFTYKSFQLDVFFNWVKQLGSNSYSFYNGTLFPGEFVRGSSNQPVTALNRWQKPGDKASVQMYSTWEDDYIYNVVSSDHFYTDASYIRLKNLSLSWQLPAKIIKTAHLQNARIYAQGQNLLTFTSYKGVDPENQSTSSLPPLRVWTIGVQVGL